MSSKNMKKLIGFVMLGEMFMENQKSNFNKRCPKCKKDGLLPLNENYTSYGCYLCGYNSDEE